MSDKSVTPTNVASVYFQLYSEYSGKRVSLNKNTQRQFNGRFSSIRAKYPFNTEELCAAILWCYKTNPLHKLSLRSYGQVTEIAKALPKFAKWYKDHKPEIVESRLSIYDYVQTHCTVLNDTTTGLVLEDYEGLYNSKRKGV